MRRLFIALMIVLLPVRGWLGDAMAMEMTQHALHAGTAATAMAAHDAHGAVPDCHGAAAESPAEAPAAASHDGCGTCTACQVCHTVALADVFPSQPARGAPHVLVPAPATGFISAEPAPGFKPPIS